MTTSLSQQDIRELQNFKNEQFQKWGIHETWSFSWGKAKSTAGTCSHGKKMIRISMVLAYARGIEETKNTILHEIAHVLAGPYAAKHGQVWKSWAVKVGARPERCFNSSTIDKSKMNYKYTLTCPNCGQTDGASRRLKRAVACASCCKKYNYGRYSEKYAFKIKQNY